MKKVMLLMGILIASYGLAHAEESMAPAVAEKADAAVEVGNKFCPISGEKVGQMGEPEKITYKGKIYNLCCSMCVKDFNKDPEAAITKIEEEMKKESQQ